MDTITTRHRKHKRDEALPDVFVSSNNTNLLETEPYQMRLRRLMDWRRQARIAQAPNRAEMAIDEDFYDGIQLDDKDIKVMQDRNQPPIIFNVIANTVNWILGTERRARIDSRVLPRAKDDVFTAKTKTKLMKYTLDCSHGEYERSFAFEECVKAGLGWLETAVRNDGGEPIFIKSERWRNMWFDHLGLSQDSSDWRFVIREKWVDLDVAIAMFPEREGALTIAAEATNSLYPYLPDDIGITDVASEMDMETGIDALFGGTNNGMRRRIKLVEAWYRLPAEVKIMRPRDNDTPYGALNGAIYRPNNEDHKYLVNGGYFTTTNARALTVRNAIWTQGVYLQDILTPYNHNQFPFTPLFCYRRKRDNMPYGVIRNLRDPQSDLNKRRSRALVLLTSNKVIMDKGAVDNKVEAYEEVNRPDGMVEVNPNKRFDVVKEQALAAAHVEMARDDERFINNISGVTPELSGQNVRDLSGVAIGKLQNQGQVTQGVYFDNLYYSCQHEGEIRLSLIEQFFDQHKEYRITGDEQKDEFVQINSVTPEGKIDNDIIRAKADFVIGKQDFRESIRQSMLETLSQLVINLSGSMPQVALALIDMVIDMMDDVPNKDEIVSRIRKITGFSGPEDTMTPEEKEEVQKENQAKQQQQQQEAQIQQAMIQLKMATEQADAAGKMARAEKDKVDSSLKKIEAFIKAMEMAGAVRVAPELAQAANKIINTDEGGQ
jgi:hypothetical protein